MEYKLPPLPESDHVINKFDGSGILGMGQVDGFTAEQMKAYAIAAIEAQGVPDGYAGAAAFVKVMPTVAIHFSTTEQALSFLDQIRASWDRQQRALASAPPAPQASVAQQEPVAKILSAGDLRGKVEWLVHSGRPISIGQFLYTHPAQQALTTCNCRWDGETQVQQCTLHEAHVEAIHEWAERAKTAEAKLSAQQAKPQPLSDEQRESIRLAIGYAAGSARFADIVRAIEAAHGIQGS